MVLELNLLTSFLISLNFIFYLFCTLLIINWIEEVCSLKNHLVSCLWLYHQEHGELCCLACLTKVWFVKTPDDTQFPLCWLIIQQFSIKQAFITELYRLILCGMHIIKTYYLPTCWLDNLSVFVFSAVGDCSTLTADETSMGSNESVSSQSSSASTSEPPTEKADHPALTTSLSSGSNSR